MLPQLRLQTGVESSHDLIVNAWIVVCEDSPQTTFVGGGVEDTVMIPATSPAVLSVAGVEPSGQIWAGSSRGPGS